MSYQSPALTKHQTPLITLGLSVHSDASLLRHESAFLSRAGRPFLKIIHLKKLAQSPLSVT